MIDCDFCIHNKVCSFKNEYAKRKEDLYHEIFEVKCKQHSSSLTTTANSLPDGVMVNYTTHDFGRPEPIRLTDKDTIK